MCGLCCGSVGKIWKPKTQHLNTLRCIHGSANNLPALKDEAFAPPVVMMASTKPPVGVEQVVAAARAGDLDAIRHAIDGDGSSASRGARFISGRNANGWTPLLSAAYYGHVPVCEFLVRVGANIEEPTAKGSTPLHHAAWNGHTAVCDYLLSVGANARAITDAGSMPLHQAAFNGKSDACVALIKGGCPINSLNASGATALHQAAYSGHAHTCRVLIGMGASIEAVTAKGSTALQQAAGQGCGEACRVLVDAGKPGVALCSSW